MTYRRDEPYYTDENDNSGGYQSNRMVMDELRALRKERDELRALVKGIADCVKNERTNKHGTWADFHMSDTDYVFSLTHEDDWQNSPIIKAIRAAYKYQNKSTAE